MVCLDGLSFIIVGFLDGDLFLEFFYYLLLLNNEAKITSIAFSVCYTFVCTFPISNTKSTIFTTVLSIVYRLFHNIGRVFDHL